MNNNTENRRKRRLNFADAIIVAVLLIIVMLLVKLFVGSYSDYVPSADNLEYTVEVKQMHPAVYPLFTVGQSVFDSKTGNEIGKIREISASQSVYSEYDITTGEYLHYQYPDLLDVRIRIVSPYKEDGLWYSVNGVAIKTGKNISIITDTAYADGVIANVETIDKSEHDIYTPSSTDIGAVN